VDELELDESLSRRGASERRLVTIGDTGRSFGVVDLEHVLYSLNRKSEQGRSVMSGSKLGRSRVL
jgi:hypothetical protein